MKKILTILCCLLFLMGGSAFASDEKKAPDLNAAARTVVEKTMGKQTKVLRIDEPAPSPVAGLQQFRVWIETPYGETPVFYYMTADRSLFLGGTIFNAEGKNLSLRDVGETVPRRINIADMKPDPAYTFGPENAPVKVVLWTGTDYYSKALIEKFLDLQERNRNIISLSFKFYPRSAPDIAKMQLLTCTQGEEFLKTYNEILTYSLNWGSPEEIAAFLETSGFKNRECKSDLVKKDLELSMSLNLPMEPRAYVNGTILLFDATAENVGRLAAVELK